MSELNQWIEFINTECEIEFIYKQEIYVVKSFNGKRYIVKDKISLSDYYECEEILEKFFLDDVSLKNLIESNEIKILTIS